MTTTFRLCIPCQCFLTGWDFLLFPPSVSSVRELNFVFHALEAFALSILLDPVCAETMESASPWPGDGTTCTFCMPADLACHTISWGVFFSSSESLAGSLLPEGLPVKMSGAPPLFLPHLEPILFILLGFGSCLTLAKVCFKSQICFWLGMVWSLIVDQVGARVRE